MTAKMKATERRALVLRAAFAAFAERGYYGTTTYEIATRASVSQPYVQRLFGGKLRLFTATLHAAFDELEAALTGAIGVAAGHSQSESRTILLDAHRRLLSESDSVRLIGQGIMSGSVPGVSAVTRSRLEVLRKDLDRLGWDRDDIDGVLGEMLRRSACELAHSPLP